MSRTTKTLIYNYATPLIMLLTGVLLYGQEIPEIPENPVDVEADSAGRAECPAQICFDYPERILLRFPCRQKWSHDKSP